jgi:preprotein translocase subunit SecE
MKKIKNYFKEIYSELVNKVTWPTWPELQASSIVVMIASFIIAIVIAIMDGTFRNLMQLVYSLFY